MKRSWRVLFLLARQRAKNAGSGLPANIAYYLLIVLAAKGAEATATLRCLSESEPSIL